MKIYLVGGAVRDRLLGLPVTEKDWVVTGSSPQEMKSLGYKPVGTDFPVYLHPDTGDEYALARTERKMGPGHRGFSVNANTAVTLEDDLKRRDLTINAIAQDESGNLIDPYGGLNDIRLRKLKHVSEAFAEDPLRILRVARFAARFFTLGFQIDEVTLDLMRSMVDEGQLNELTPERVWVETEKSLSCEQPGIYFRVLNEVNALDIVFPGVLPIQIDFLDRFAPVHVLPEERFALLAGTMDKKVLASLCIKLKIPNLYKDLSNMIAEHLNSWKDIRQMSPRELVDFIYKIDGLRRPERMRQFNEICFSLAPIQDGDGEAGTLQIKQFLNDCGDTIRRTGSELLTEEERCLKGAKLGEAIKNHQAREIAILTGHFNDKKP
ncbi:MAG: multifunctional CCA tRNA nucleotidyl transferase/2'3'-cyclic phosphodiesterase/2'nucleotidase/phosphatase [Gammaproteobacteria bacterium]|nr:multifunctional CCA tRNA nucleotidyl transferase/2'3'-cyclic phosphodiesterase/2'nucleotidase/phosphatase [Gammaproteobacteria bacterium]